MSEATDPINSTDAAFNRRTFVGLSVAATAVAATLATANAQELGKPHPPFVPEDDPEIVVERPHLSPETTDGALRAIDAYYAAPKNAGPATPGVVVVMHIWGVDTQIRDTVRRLAKAGYRAIAPNLYSGLGAPNGDGADDYRAFVPKAGELSDSQVDADLAAGAEYLRRNAGEAKIGVTGFCLGGSIALRQAVDKPNLYRAAAMWYGKVRYGTGANIGPITPIALAYVDEIKVPLLGSFGARDTSIKADDVRALDRRLTELRKPHDLKVYDEAGHGFFDDTRDSYVASAASDAYARTLAWFAKHLR